MSTVEAHHVSANDLDSTKKLQIHRSFQKKAPAELVAYIKDRIDELEKSMKELRQMECTGQNLDVVMEQTSGTAKGGTLYSLEITVERLRKRHIDFQEQVSVYGNAKIPNTLQRILGRRGDAKHIKEYIEGLHGLLNESLRVLSETAKTTTSMRKLVSDANAAFGNYVIDLTEDIGS